MLACPPLPVDDAEVWDDFDRRSDAWEAGPTPPQPALLELVDRLTSRHPCVSGLRGDQLDETVWADGPVADGLMHDTAILTLADHRAAEVLVLLREHAAALGIAVYDPQTERIWRP